MIVCYGNAIFLVTRWRITKQYKFYWQLSQENLGDYPSKHHTAEIYQHVRPYYVHMDKSPTLLPRAI